MALNGKHPVSGQKISYQAGWLSENLDVFPYWRDGTQKKNTNISVTSCAGRMEKIIAMNIVTGFPNFLYPKSSMYGLFTYIYIPQK